MKRLETGLIDGLNYVYNENKKIDWLKMVPEKYLYINQDKKDQLEKRLGKSFSEIQIKDVNDNDLVITLQGIRFLLDTRGYKYAKMRIDSCSADFAAATCEICFIPNVEEQFEQVFTGSASAHPGNTKSWYANYLVEAASNRALCRATRNFLKIETVSKEELGNGNGQPDESAPTKSSIPHALLEENLRGQGWTLDKLKNILIAKAQKKYETEAEAVLNQKWSVADSWTKIEDIAPDMAYEIIKMIQAKKKS